MVVRIFLAEFEAGFCIVQANRKRRMTSGVLSSPSVDVPKFNF